MLLYNIFVEITIDFRKNRKNISKTIVLIDKSRQIYEKIVIFDLKTVAIIIGIIGNNDNNSSDFVDCLSCGDSFDETMNFCPNCGAKKETPNTDNNDNSNSDGNNNTNVCSHNWKTATCTTPKTCSKCGETSGNALGHTWKSASCTQPKTCSKCGKKEGNALGHTTSTGICTRCNVRQGWTKSEVQNIIKIRMIRVDQINSVGSVDMDIGWENTSNKTIKYIYFHVDPYNAVGDKVTCEIGDHSRYIGKSTGPFEAGYKSYYEFISGEYMVGSIWECCWYNNTVKTIELVEIKIDYADGTSVVLDESAIQYAFTTDEYDDRIIELDFVDYISYSDKGIQFSVALLNANQEFAKKHFTIDFTISNGSFVYSDSIEISPSDYSTNGRVVIVIPKEKIAVGEMSYGNLSIHVYGENFDFEDSQMVLNMPQKEDDSTESGTPSEHICNYEFGICTVCGYPEPGYKSSLDDFAAFIMQNGEYKTITVDWKPEAMSFYEFTTDSYADGITYTVTATYWEESKTIDFEITYGYDDIGDWLWLYVPVDEITNEYVWYLDWYFYDSDAYLSGEGTVKTGIDLNNYSSNNIPGELLLFSDLNYEDRDLSEIEDDFLESAFVYIRLMMLIFDDYFANNNIPLRMEFLGLDGGY